MHSFLTFVFPTNPSDRGKIETELDRLSNPASKDLRDALRHSLLIHFMSSALVYGDTGEKDQLVLEMSTDAEPQDIYQLFEHTGSGLSQLFDPLFSLIDPSGGPKSRFLQRHRLTTGNSYFKAPGLNFTGTPGMTVKRIRDEYRFARTIRDYFDKTNMSGPPLEIVENLRRNIQTSPDFQQWKGEPYDFTPMLELETTPILDGPKQDPGSLSMILALASKVIMTLMWPALLLAAIIAVLCLPDKSLSWGTLWAFSWRFGLWTLALISLSLVWFAFNLRRKEAKEDADLSLPNLETLSQVRAREDRGYQQNHLFGVSRMKPGIIRKISMRLVFMVIGHFGSKVYAPGYLGGIGTIHFARWFRIPGTDKLIFCSNYGGSWESYLEDFITKAHDGLTGVWSNTFGFPKARLLFFKGAVSGEKFKRWARRQQIPTRLWYCAYPHLSTDRIRTNAAIRRGIASAATEDEAKSFLALFASQQRPDNDVVRDEIQTLMFGGLGRHEQSACILLRLPSDPAKAKAWLAEQKISFGGAPNAKQVNQISLTASGLKKLKLPEEALSQFSFPFLQGMDHKDRSRALADTGDDKPDDWNWGHGADSVDAAFLVYMASDKTLSQKARISKSRNSLEAYVRSFARKLEMNGGQIIQTVITTHLDDRKIKNKGNDDWHREPFGFVDGVSQPIIRGLKRGNPKAGSNLHMAEPGEFILGYPDNRGTQTLLPTLPASKDPDNILPVFHPVKDQTDKSGLYPNYQKSGVNADRAFGENGSYLVIRQLAQDADGFNTYVKKAAKAVKGHRGIPDWYSQKQTEEFLAAKMVGRWKDGTSLVKFPYEPGTGWNGKNPNRSPDNEFLLGQEDPTGSLCPYGSHIRRSNPRDSFQPRDEEQLKIVNRHRILRRGRFYKDKDGKKNAGLMFMCLNADIERQFEFIQQTWCMASQFMGLENEVDPVIGRGGKMGRLTIPTPEGPIFLKGSPDAVTVIGGAYLFMPSKAALKYLAR